ncbi:MAG: hypothetical protein KC729_05105 [Candidatus Eisenbacteria bacterium]|uniref:Uncharacterized protein n=1 Tax=Eiseniibacteriota bacterium TaxID=2212470 RepID=A0A956LZL8_UNCEI|nr:hypothetical protein [Candidatus Eisenbacteria bacterium]
MNPSIGELAQRLDQAQAVVLTTHSGPDGDGLGCLVALRRALEAHGKTVLALLPDELGSRYRFLDPEGRMIVVDDAGADDTRYDLALVLDTHDRQLLRGVNDWLEPRRIPLFFLDHHPLADGPRPEVYGDIDAVATGCLIYRMLREHLHWPLDREIAEPLYISLSFDTNSFKYLRNDPEALLIAADLIRSGVDTTWVYRHLFASNPRRKAQALGWILSHVKFVSEGRMATVAIPHTLVSELQLDRDDLRDGITHILEIEGVEVAAALKEMHPGAIKISLRSKGNYHVNQVAQALGGGGHNLAAGCEMDGTLEQATSEIESRLEAVLAAGAVSASGSTH